MKIIGIVGGIGAGKTTIVSILTNSKPSFVIGADEVGHEILMPQGSAYAEVIAAFGKDILDKKGYIIRRKLGEIVFKDKKEIEMLNKITHPKIYSEIETLIEKCKAEEKYEWLIIDAALLVEIDLIKLTNLVIGVYAKEEVRIERIMKRENFSYEQALNRIRVQKKWEELEKVAQHIIDNSFSYQYTKEQIDKMIATW